MNDIPPVIHECVILGLFLGCFAVIALIRSLLLRYRSRSIQRCANELGLGIYQDEDELLAKEGWDIADLTYNNALLSKGHHYGHKLFNIMYAEHDNLALFVFDHQYLQSAKRTTIDVFGNRQTVVAIVSADIDVQKFELSVTAMAKGGFYEDFAVGVLEFFEKHPRTTVEGYRQSIVIYEPGRRVKPSEYSELVGRGFEVFQILKNKCEAQHFVS